MRNLEIIKQFFFERGKIQPRHDSSEVLREGAKFIVTRAGQGDSGAVTFLTTKRYLFTGNSVNNDHNLTSNSYVSNITICFKLLFDVIKTVRTCNTKIQSRKKSPPRYLPARPWFQVIMRPPLFYMTSMR